MPSLTLSMTDWRRTIRISKSSAGALVLFVMFIFTRLIHHWIGYSISRGSVLEKKFYIQQSPPSYMYSTELNCALNCSQNPSPLRKHIVQSQSEECPEYFKWMHDDLSPWRETGITREMVEKGMDVADIRIVIVNGRLYVEGYRQAYQTRDVMTVWGILQLLRLYPGRLPDLDFMFSCGDMPLIMKSDYNTSMPPPLFHYCGDEQSYDIVFPDWSFWGWTELNIKPWEILKDELHEGNKRIVWKDREPYAYWRGNIWSGGAARRGLVECNASNEHDTKTRIIYMSWRTEMKSGFNTSDLANECTYRYKIYVEGVTWSVSQKYIMACDSMSLVITPQYYDFLSRSFLPGIHYWPINEKDKCRSITQAVEWGNKYTEKAQEIGKSGSKFIQENLRMKYIYDYMFHLLNDYGKLMKYKPTVPIKAVEVCTEGLFCSAQGQEKRFMEDTMIKSPADLAPCHGPF